MTYNVSCVEILKLFLASGRGSLGIHTCLIGLPV